MHRTSLDFWRNFDKRDMASHLISHTLYKLEQMKTSWAHFVVHIGQKPFDDQKKLKKAPILNKKWCYEKLSYSTIVRFHTIWLWTWTLPIFTLVERGNHYVCQFSNWSKEIIMNQEQLLLNNSWLLFLFFSISDILQGWAYRVLRKKVWRKSQTMEKLFSPEVLKKFQMNRIRQIVQPLFL